jgi:dephospho-CoA kinase
MIIGISGSFSSGKDTLAKHLNEVYGFMGVNTGDIVREIAQVERGSIERPVLQEVADELRHKYGGGVLVERALDRYHNSIRNYPGCSIVGLRSLGEAKAIKEQGGTLVFVDAPIEIRYERMIARARDDEKVITLEEFRQREEAELSSGSSDADFNLLEIEKLADVKLVNDTTAEAFLRQADSVLFS